MPGLRAAVAVTSLCVVAACDFVPSGGASPGGGGDGDGGDGGPAVPTDAAGGIGGDKADAPVAALDLCAPADGLVACYRFESNLEDGSGQDNDLSGAGYTFGAGSDGSALALDDGTAMGAISDASLDFTAALTVEAWLAPGESQERWFVDHDNRWGIEIEEDWTVRCTVRLDGTDEEDETTAVELAGGHAGAGAWTHVACTYGGGAVVLYVGGAEVDRGAGAGPIHTGDGDGFTVGRDAPEGDSFVGLIDTVRIWSLARKPAEIACSAAGEC